MRVQLVLKANTKTKTISPVAKTIAMPDPTLTPTTVRVSIVLKANTKIKTTNRIASLVGPVRLRKMQQRFAKLVKRGNTSTTKLQRNTNAKVVLLVNMP